MAASATADGDGDGAEPPEDEAWTEDTSGSPIPSILAFSLSGSAQPARQASESTTTSKDPEDASGPGPGRDTESSDTESSDTESSDTESSDTERSVDLEGGAIESFIQPTSSGPANGATAPPTTIAIETVRGDQDDTDDTDDTDDETSLPSETVAADADSPIPLPSSASETTPSTTAQAQPTTTASEQVEPTQTPSTEPDFGPPPTTPEPEIDIESSPS